MEDQVLPGAEAFEQRLDPRSFEEAAVVYDLADAMEAASPLVSGLGELVAFQVVDDGKGRGDSPELLDQCRPVGAVDEEPLGDFLVELDPSEWASLVLASWHVVHSGQSSWRGGL